MPTPELQLFAIAVEGKPVSSFCRWLIVSSAILKEQYSECYPLSERRSRWPGRSAGCRPVPSNRARQRTRQPASPRPRTGSSNPSLSSGESTSRAIFPSHDEKPAFRSGVGPAGAARSAETGIARCMAPTGGNISVGPNSSTAASMRRWLNEFRSRSGKAEHGPLLVPGKR